MIFLGSNGDTKGISSGSKKKGNVRAPLVLLELVIVLLVEILVLDLGILVRVAL